MTVKSLKVRRQQIVSMIENLIIFNDFFVDRADTLFKDNHEFPETDTNLSYNEEEGGDEAKDPFASYIDEDIFFEVADEYDEDLDQ